METQSPARRTLVRASDRGGEKAFRAILVFYVLGAGLVPKAR